MIKTHKRTLLLTSLVILLPVFAGLLLWRRLPPLMPTHWGPEGTADGWSGKAFAVFGLPLILLAVHWLCILITAWDRGNRNQNRKVFGMVLWILPVLSVFVSAVLYGSVLYEGFPMEMAMLLLMGMLFLVIGNYLPKCRQNRTIGIKVKWALESEENWNATHRMAGKLWVAGGVLFCLCAFLGERAVLWSMGLVLPVMVLVPVAYSGVYYRKQMREGRISATAHSKKNTTKTVLVVSAVVSAVLLGASAVLCFTGDIAISYGDETFTVVASYYQDLTVEYETVDSIEFRETDSAGRRQFGFGTPRLLMGSFRNDEFGAYTRYSYTQCDSGVVLRSGDEVLVLSGIDREATLAIYEELSQKCK